MQRNEVSLKTAEGESQILDNQKPDSYDALCKMLLDPFKFPEAKQTLITTWPDSAAFKWINHNRETLIDIVISKGLFDLVSSLVGRETPITADNKPSTFLLHLLFRHVPWNKHIIEWFAQPQVQDQSQPNIALFDEGYTIKHLLTVTGETSLTDEQEGSADQLGLTLNDYAMLYQYKNMSTEEYQNKSNDDYLFEPLHRVITQGLFAGVPLYYILMAFGRRVEHYIELLSVTSSLKKGIAWSCSPSHPLNQFHGKTFLALILANGEEYYHSLKNLIQLENLYQNNKIVSFNDLLVDCGKLAGSDYFNFKVLVSSFIVRCHDLDLNRTITANDGSTTLINFLIHNHPAIAYDLLVYYEKSNDVIEERNQIKLSAPMLPYYCGSLLEYLVEKGHYQLSENIQKPASHENCYPLLQKILYTYNLEHSLPWDESISHGRTVKSVLLDYLKETLDVNLITLLESRKFPINELFPYIGDPSKYDTPEMKNLVDKALMACREGDVATLRAYRNFGLQVNRLVVNGQTPLSIVVEDVNFEMLVILVEDYNCDLTLPTAGINNIFFQALFSENKNSVRDFIQKIQLTPYKNTEMSYWQITKCNVSHAHLNAAQGKIAVSDTAEMPIDNLGLTPLHYYFLANFDRLNPAVFRNPKLYEPFTTGPFKGVNIIYLMMIKLGSSAIERIVNEQNVLLDANCLSQYLTDTHGLSSYNDNSLALIFAAKNCLSPLRKVAPYMLIQFLNESIHTPNNDYFGASFAWFLAKNDIELLSRIMHSKNNVSIDVAVAPQSQHCPEQGISLAARLLFDDKNIYENKWWHLDAMKRPVSIGTVEINDNAQTNYATRNLLKDYPNIFRMYKEQKIQLLAVNGEYRIINIENIISFNLFRNDTNVSNKQGTTLFSELLKTGKIKSANLNAQIFPVKHPLRGITIAFGLALNQNFQLLDTLADSNDVDLNATLETVVTGEENTASLATVLIQQQQYDLLGKLYSKFTKQGGVLNLNATFNGMNLVECLLNDFFKLRLYNPEFLQTLIKDGIFKGYETKLAARQEQHEKISAEKKPAQVDISKETDLDAYLNNVFKGYPVTSAKEGKSAQNVKVSIILPVALADNLAADFKKLNNNGVKVTGPMFIQKDKIKKDKVVELTGNKNSILTSFKQQKFHTNVNLPIAAGSNPAPAKPESNPALLPTPKLKSVPVAFVPGGSKAIAKLTEEESAAYISQTLKAITGFEKDTEIQSRYDQEQDAIIFKLPFDNQNSVYRLITVLHNNKPHSCLMTTELADKVVGWLKTAVGDSAKIEFNKKKKEIILTPYGQQIIFKKVHDNISKAMYDAGALSKVQTSQNYDGMQPTTKKPSPIPQPPKAEENQSLSDDSLRFFKSASEPAATPNEFTTLLLKIAKLIGINDSVFVFSTTKNTTASDDMINTKWELIFSPQSKQVFGTLIFSVDFFKVLKNVLAKYLPVGVRIFDADANIVISITDNNKTDVLNQLNKLLDNQEFFDALHDELEEYYLPQHDIFEDQVHTITESQNKVALLQKPVENASTLLLDLVSIANLRHHLTQLNALGNINERVSQNDPTLKFDYHVYLINTLRILMILMEKTTDPLAREIFRDWRNILRHAYQCFDSRSLFEVLGGLVTALAPIAKNIKTISISSANLVSVDLTQILADLANYNAFKEELRDKTLGDSQELREQLAKLKREFRECIKHLHEYKETAKNKEFYRQNVIDILLSILTVLHGRRYVNGQHLYGMIGHEGLDEAYPDFSRGLYDRFIAPLWVRFYQSNQADENKPTQDEANNNNAIVPKMS